MKLPRPGKQRAQHVTILLAYLDSRGKSVMRMRRPVFATHIAFLLLMPMRNPRRKRSHCVRPDLGSVPTLPMCCGRSSCA
jgi:hypothetical protein